MKKNLLSILTTAGLGILSCFPNFGCSNNDSKPDSELPKRIDSVEAIQGPAFLEDINGDGKVDIVSLRVAYNCRPSDWLWFFDNTGEYSYTRVPVDYVKEQREKAYNKLYLKLLELSDRDGNRVTSFQEQVQTWRDMGYKEIFIESQGKEQFPKPSVFALADQTRKYEKAKKAQGETIK